jgi:hypothetical protein
VKQQVTVPRIGPWSGPFFPWSLILPASKLAQGGGKSVRSRLVNLNPLFYDDERSVATRRGAARAFMILDLALPSVTKACFR